MKSIPKNGQPRRKVTDRLAYVWTTNQNCVFILVGIIIAYSNTKNPPELSSKGFIFIGSIISVVGKTTVEIIELFECRQKVP